MNSIRIMACYLKPFVFLFGLLGFFLMIIAFGYLFYFTYFLGVNEKRKWAALFFRRNTKQAKADRKRYQIAARIGFLGGLMLMIFPLINDLNCL